MDIFPYTNGLGQFEFSFESSNDYTSDMLRLWQWKYMFMTEGSSK